MAQTRNFLACFLIVFLTCLQIERYAAVHIDISPDRINDLRNESVQISCLPGRDDLNIEKIFLIDLYKTGEKEPVVSVDRGSPATFGSGNHIGLEAQGHIDDDIGKSFLILKIVAPKLEDAGTYTCTVSAVDEAGMIKHSKASAKLTYENSMLQSKINAWSDSATRRSQQITSLQHREHLQRVFEYKGNYKSAFVATLDKAYSPYYNEQFVFPKITMQIGNSYATSGTFYCHLAGFYNFNLFVTMYRLKNWVRIILKVNGFEHVGLSASEMNLFNYPKSSISALVKLNRGDQVSLMLEGKTVPGKVSQPPFAFFNGYLIQPLY